MYEQTLYKIIEPIKKTTLTRLNRGKKWKYGYDKEHDLVGFDPVSKFEFVVDGKRMYRALSKFITIKYEYQGDEEEYNPSWAQSG